MSLALKDLWETERALIIVIRSDVRFALDMRDRELRRVFLRQVRIVGCALKAIREEVDARINQGGVR